MSTENKRFYWIKLRENFFQQETIDWLMEQENGSAYIVLYLKMCLLTANTSGELIRTIGDMTIPYEPKKISQKTGFDIDTVNVALSLFKHLGLIEETQGGIPVMPEVKNMVGSESESAARVRKYRKKKKALQSNVDVTKKALQSNVEIRDKRIEYRDKENREESVDVESKKKETGASDDGLKDVITAYRKNIYPMPGEMDLEKLKALADDFGSDTVIKAIDRAVTRNKRSLAYIHGILKSWQAGGYDDENAARPQPTPRNSKKEAIDVVNRLMAEYQAQEGEEKDDNDNEGIDPATDWSFATGVQK
ncbi:phage replisome organizer N-terminal domain-containing protein [Megasphaera elsdenii]|uniref:phage replisome organizer N-terminal domain-containing protein n=1 Tax=Megasphaera elsdenii TaxID=907 RepID=UPI00092327AE|nr:phage replisome organizer N-terminal domain-containing protein [Megasphaera elsdenii]SHK02464.1 phage replisome organizer, putative, N-terminal region [Megasphaera elsdenii]